MNYPIFLTGCKRWYDGEGKKKKKKKKKERGRGGGRLSHPLTAEYGNLNFSKKLKFRPRSLSLFL
jgi:hypothetical protein